ncbi:MAG TPA: efflux RND transporter periplasmic adaptor subunit [Candidatus Limnocylindria bacterium]|nr:efflux RND transporter periplasmic adaptor subunit [Candidatus Limnocylindria bacterium]
MKAPLFELSACTFTLALAALLVGCSKDAPKPPTPPPVEVSVVTVAAESVERTTELPGRINPVREAQVRARATGILLKRSFEEGADVKEGQVLFEIDPLPLQATLASSKAALAKMEASLTESKARAARYEELVKINAISKQVYDEAVATLGQNEADLLAAKAALQTSELNLGYAQVTAPISGRIGRAMVTEGALVSATDATQLAVIRQLDPVYFDFTQSSADVLRLRRAMESGALQGANANKNGVTVTLEDGTVYPHPGKLLFSDIAVDPTTGMITLRAEVPNPENLLLPGMYARGQIVEGVTTNALTIPQRTIVRGTAGTSTVFVVNDQDAVEVRSITIDRTVGSKVVVAKGLKAGEKVIVEGTQKVRPGATVKPVPFTAPAAGSAPKPN